MSNNEPDYDNLAFDPGALNPCNGRKRSSDVLTATLEKCQAIVAKNVELEKKLEIAVKALEFYANKENNYFGNTVWEDWEGDKFAYVSGDIENGYKAREALAKIKEIK